MPSTVKFYGYSGCGTCRKAKQWLKDNGVAFEEIAIRDQPPTAAEMKRMLTYLDLETKRLLNTSSKDYRDLGGKEHFGGLSVDAVFETLRKNGNLIKRPFVLTDDTGTVGFKPDVWAEKFL